MENESPLRKFKRTPKLYIDIPSKGKWSHRDTFEKVEEVEVFSMTANDELAVRTPDALYTGQAVKSLIENCVPSIRNAFQIPSIDVDYILAAIRIASYGDTINFGSKCAKCNESNEYSLELQAVMDHISSQVYENEVKVEDFIIRTRPFTYKELTEVQKETLKLQRQIVQNMDKADADEDYLNQIYQQINELTQGAIVAMVTEIVTPDGDSETNPIFIKDFIFNQDKVFYTAVKQMQERNTKRWKIPSSRVKCEACGHEDDVETNLDYANFFVKG